MMGLRLLFFVIIVFAQTSFAQQEVPVKCALSAPAGTQSVYIIGDFNNWSATTHPLRYETATKLWTIDLMLAPGSYEYRFIINGLNRIKDPANPVWGGENSNSILYVQTQMAPVLKNLTPETGSTISAVPFRIEAEYWDGLGRYGLDETKTCVLVDNKAVPFEFFAPKRQVRAWSPRLEPGDYAIRVESADKNGNTAISLESFIHIKSGNSAPVVDAGYSIISGTDDEVHLNTSLIYDPDMDEIRKFEWRLTKQPKDSKVKLQDRGNPVPRLKPDTPGRYVVSLKVNDGTTDSQTDSVDVHAFVKRTYPTEFQLADSAFRRIYETSIDSAYLAGEFNNWASSAVKMTDYDHDGIRTAWVDLNPGEYEYKFVVNGQYWIADPANPQQVPDGWNAFNSVKSVTLNLAPVIHVKGLFQPGAVVLDASKTNSKTGEDLIIFWYQDINNPQKVKMEGTSRLRIEIPQKSGTYYFYVVASDKFGSSSRKTISLKVKGRKVEIFNFSDSPDWAADAIIYDIYVKAFSPDGSLRGIIGKLPYLKKLGVNCISLLPIWESPTELKFGASDFFRVADEYGTIDDFKALVDAAHHMGIRVILDVTFAYTSDQHPYFVSAFQNAFGAYRDFYRWYEASAQPLLYAYEFSNDWDRFPNLNFENPQVQKYLVDIARFWVQQGIDGFRCSNARGVPHEFWKRFRHQIKELSPDCVLLNEALSRSPDYHNDEFDMSFDTDFYNSLIDVMNQRKPVSAIERALRKTETNYPPHALMLRYLENHQMERFIQQHGIMKTQVAAALLLTTPGTPMLFYGQEHGVFGSLAKMNWDESHTKLLEYYRTLITIRREYPAIRRSPMQYVPTNHPNDVLAYIRRDETHTILVLLNFSPETIECQAILKDITSARSLHLEELITNSIQPVTLDPANRAKLKLEGETAYIFHMSE
ncbi:hypothetical protein JW960_12465 [candidate division KSB1 bacterium]|nr:hypothetical protein [candidate division KSB1 bacterium]